MDPFRKDHNRRRRITPFDFFDDDDFDELFDEMSIILGSTPFREMIKKILREEVGADNRIIYKLNLEIILLGRPKVLLEKPRIQKSFTCPLNNSMNSRITSEESATLPDIIERKEDVAVTIEIPDVEKKDINLNVSENEIELTIDNPKKKYHDHIMLPCSVKPRTAKTTYKNGVFDIVLKRKKEKD